MCLNHPQLDPKIRYLMVIANIALILVLLLSSFQRWHWIQLFSPFEQNSLDAFTGFCFGLYSTIVLFGLRGVRRCGIIHSGNR
jgi:uncharacterized membrane protein